MLRSCLRNEIVSAILIRFVTDHDPLQWLSAQKWRVSSVSHTRGWFHYRQEYIMMWSSRSPLAATQFRIDHEKRAVYSAQHSEPVSNILRPNPRVEKGMPPLICYWQKWNQLTLVDGVTLQKVYAPGPSSDIITVPILPRSLQPDALYCSHEAPAGGLSRCWENIEVPLPASILG